MLMLLPSGIDAFFLGFTVPVLLPLAIYFSVPNTLLLPVPELGFFLAAVSIFLTVGTTDFVTSRFLAKYFSLSSTNLASRSASTLSNPVSFTLAEGLALLIIPLLSKYFFLSSTNLASLASSASFLVITFYP